MTEKEYELWIKHAVKDLDTAKYLLEEKRLEDCAFYCQQSAEKALKALYIKNKEEIIRIHDITRLGRVLELPQELIEACIRLTPIYFTARYPDSKGFSSLIYTKRDCEEFITDSNKIIKWVKKNL
jgi:HEPN domain-containing protein